MTNPTSNYAWQMPTPTDLVTDLPADFEVFGQAVDNSLWNVGFGQAGKNKIINGDFGINQRAFTSSTTTGQYVYDRFVSQNSGGTVTFSTQTFTVGTAPVAGYEGKNYVRCVTTGQSAAGDQAFIRSRIESVRTFAGQTATISFWAKANTGTPKVGATFVQVFGSGGSPSSAVIVNGQSATTSTSWARYSFTFAIPSISGKTLGTNNDDGLQLEIWFSAGTDAATRSGTVGIQSNTFEIWGVQAEYGSKMTPFQTASGGSPQAELAMCQRYYWRFTPSAAGDRFGNGLCDSTTVAQLLVQFPVSMRTAPSALEQSGTATDYQVRTAAATSTNCSSVPTYSATSTNSALVSFTVSSGLVAGQAMNGRAVNTAAYLGWSAEL